MNTAAKNWNDLDDLMDVHTMSSTDEECINEIQSVIEKYGLTGKFGVSLLHKHFDLENDEILLETNDPIQRELSSRPVKISEISSKDYIPTIIRFDDGQKYGCSYCSKDHC